jgi:hypothetical protein
MRAFPAFSNYFLAFKPFGLLGQMASDPRVNPLLDLVGEMKNFDGHGLSPRTLPRAAGAAPGRHHEEASQTMWVSC